MSHGHIRRSHYVILIFTNLISAAGSYLNPVEFGWNSAESVLMPNKYIVTLPEMYTVTCGCKKKLHWKTSVQQVWSLHPHNFASPTEKNVVSKFRDYIRYANIKVFCEPNFHVYGQNPRTYTGKYVSEKTHIFACFTQYDICSLICPETYTSLNKNNRHYTENN